MLPADYEFAAQRAVRQLGAVCERIVRAAGRIQGATPDERMALFLDISGSSPAARAWRDGADRGGVEVERCRIHADDEPPAMLGGLRRDGTTAEDGVVMAGRVPGSLGQDEGRRLTG